jgi:hypothetical protein
MLRRSLRMSNILSRCIAWKGGYASQYPRMADRDRWRQGANDCFHVWIAKYRDFSFRLRVHPLAPLVYACEYLGQERCP